MQKMWIGFIATGFFSLSACHPANQQQTLFAADSVAVRIARVAQATATTGIICNGLLTTDREAKYAFKIGGVVEQVLVDEGQSFKKGQLLATLRGVEIDAQLQQAALAAEKAGRDYSRAKNLYEDSVATLEQFQNARTGLELANRSVELLAFNKQYTKIYAQADGFVTRKLANPGEVIAAGSPVIAINETGLRQSWVIKAGVTDAQWAGIRTGDKARITMDAFPHRVFAGEIVKKYLAADQGSGTFTVEIGIQQPEKNFALGMFAEVSIETGVSGLNPVIPYDALIEANGDDAYVFTPVANHRVKKVPIKIAAFNQQQVTVRSGLEGISRVVVANTAFLNEQSIISIQP